MPKSWSTLGFAADSQAVNLRPLHARLVRGTAGQAARGRIRSLLAIAVRAAWLGSLFLLVRGCSELVDTDATLDVDRLLLMFGGGVLLAWLTVIFSIHARIRWAAIATGTGNGGVGLLLWTMSSMSSGA